VPSQSLLAARLSPDSRIGPIEGAKLATFAPESDPDGAMIARAVVNFYLGYRPEAVRSAPSVGLVPLGGPD
jgi:hypothetical protein